LNGIPLSDAGGNTYLNLLDPQLVQGVSLVKGPAASLYGAGTQGVVLLDAAPSSSLGQHGQVQAGLGSYGLAQGGFRLENKSQDRQSLVHGQWLQQTGYRQQTALQKGQFYGQLARQLKRTAFNGFVLLAHLRYQTPGGLTAGQVAADRRQARPSTATLPGAVAQEAGVQNNTVLTGWKAEHKWGQGFFLKGFLSLGKTSFKNPFITNFEKRDETQFNTGFQWGWQKAWRGMKAEMVVGGEALFLEADIQQFDNDFGKPGRQQSHDLVRAGQRFLFGQINLTWSQGWQVQLGSSSNLQSYDYKRQMDLGQAWKERRARAPFVPRLAIQYRFRPNVLVYALASKGFSPPSLAEFRPSDGLFYPFLQPEFAENVEAGFRWNSPSHPWQWSLAFYRNRLLQTITRRLDPQGQEYFVNAGTTAQNGVEVQFQGTLYQQAKASLGRWDIRGQFSWQDHRFLQYQAGQNDYSGNPLTGVPQAMAQLSQGFYFQHNWDVQLGFQYTGALTLNDAATVRDKGFWVGQCSVKKTFQWKAKTISCQGLVDNLLNVDYALGNDINAAGNRFYNPAPGRNYSILVKLSW
jgi:iron complex outermembrane receptor protein